MTLQKKKTSYKNLSKTYKNLDLEVGIQGSSLLDIEDKVISAIDNRFKRGRASVRMIGESVRRGKVFSVSFTTKTELDIEEVKQLKDLLKVVVFQAIAKSIGGTAKIKTYT